jgi:hypothetical protein
VFVAEYTCGLLATSFPNMTPTQIQAAVAGMMQIEDKRAFKHHMRDFLVQVRAWSVLRCMELAPAVVVLHLVMVVVGNLLLRMLINCRHAVAVGRLPASRQHC